MLSLRTGKEGNQQMTEDSQNPGNIEKVKKPAHLLNSPLNTLAVYTVLKILFKMKSVLGLEAMLDYMGMYLSVLEKHNPEIKIAVLKALTFINVEKIYLEAVNDEKA